MKKATLVQPKITSAPWTPLMEAVKHKAIRNMSSVKYLYAALAPSLVDHAMHYFRGTDELTQTQVDQITAYVTECITDEEAISGS